MSRGRTVGLREGSDGFPPAFAGVNPSYASKDSSIGDAGRYATPSHHQSPAQTEAAARGGGGAAVAARSEFHPAVHDPDAAEGNEEKS